MLSALIKELLAAASDVSCLKTLDYRKTNELSANETAKEKLENSKAITGK